MDVLDPIVQEAHRVFHGLGGMIHRPTGWTREARRKVLKTRRRARALERERQARGR